MTLKAFLFLLVVTIVAVTGAALVAEMLLPPGFERGIVIAVLSGLVVFPAARWAEYRGWIKGAWSPGGDLRRERDARKEEEARAAAQLPEGLPADGSPRPATEPAASVAPATLPRTEEPPPAGQAPSALTAGDLKYPGDSR